MHACAYTDTCGHVPTQLEWPTGVSSVCLTVTVPLAGSTIILVLLSSLSILVVASLVCHAAYWLLPKDTVWREGDPCEYANDNECDVPQHCASGDYDDCGTGPLTAPLSMRTCDFV